MIERIVETSSLATLVEILPKLKAQLREGRSAEVIRELFSIDLWEIDRELVQFSNQLAAQVSIQASTQASSDLNSPAIDNLAEGASQALAESDRAAAENMLPHGRTASCYSADGAVALAKILIILCADTKDTINAPLFRTEALVAIQRARSLNADKESLAILDAYKPIIKLYGLSNAIEMRTASVKSLDAFDQLLRQNPEHPEVIIAAAKAQTYADHDFVPRQLWQEKLQQLTLQPVFIKAASKLLKHARFA